MTSNSIEARIATATMKAIHNPEDKKTLRELDVLFLVKEKTKLQKPDVLLGRPVRYIGSGDNA